MIAKIWSIFTSLRLTVVCLAFGIVLVFLGTIAQVNEGLWQAQERWFKSYFIWVGHVPVMPGGYLVGIVLVLNLLAAHIKRFQFTKKKIGINLTHTGIILLLVGQLATDLLSHERLISFSEGETRAFTEDHRDNELVFIAPSANGEDEVVSIPEAMLAAGKEIAHEKLPFAVRVKAYHPNSEVISIQSAVAAGQQLNAALATVQAQYASADGLAMQAERAQESEGRLAVWREALDVVGEKNARDIVAAAKSIAAQPERAARLLTELKTRFQQQMLRGFKMSGMNPSQSPTGEDKARRFVAERLEKNLPLTADAFTPASSTGMGARIFFQPLPATQEMDKRNLPAAVIELMQGGKSLGTWLVSPWLNDEDLNLAGAPWRTAFRLERNYLPFSVKLLKTTHEVYAGTTVPKNYQSRVRLENPTTGENREVDIYMNNPLRYAGLTFYQSQMDRFTMPGFSGLQVVKNPSWLAPYLGCALVALGMVWQFMYHLIGFITKRRAT